MTELFLEVMNRSISASWLVGAVLLARVLLKRCPRWVTMLLWAMVAVRLVCPALPESPVSLVPSTQTIAPEIMLDWSPQIDTGIPVLNEAVNPVIAESFAPEPAASANPLQILIPVAAAVWILGMGVMGLYTLGSYWLLQRKLRTATVLRYNIYQSEYVPTPFVLGIWKPRVYLPYTMSQENILYVIAHEKAHIRRRDHWWKPLGFLLVTVYWFNPVLWLGYRAFCRDIELACDEAVIRNMNNQQRADYAGALLACSVRPHTLAACPLAFGEVGVKTRIKSVMHYRKPAFWILLVAAVLCLAVAVCFLTDPKTVSQSGVSYHYGTVVDQAMSAVKEGSRESREYISLRCDDGQELLLWAKDSGTTLPDVRGQHVWVRSEKEAFADRRIVTKVAITEHTWADNLEEAIHNAILDYNWYSSHADRFCSASYVTLASEAGGRASENAAETVTVYGLARYSTFVLRDGQVEEESGNHIPVVMTFDIADSGKYMLKEYWEPRDGTYYVTDIRAKFPEGVWPDTQEYVAQQDAENFAKAAAYYGVEANLPEQTEETAAAAPSGLEKVSDLAYFMELSAPDKEFRDMSPEKRAEIIPEYGGLLDGYDLIARESTDGTLAYIVGFWPGAVEESPLYHLHSVSRGDENGEVELLYDERDLEAAEKYEEPEYKYVIHNSHLNHSPSTGCFLIHPTDSGWGFNDVFNSYLRPKGREYLLDAFSRGIALSTPEGPYLEVYLISETWGEITERIPLTEEQAAQILSEPREKLDAGHGFAAGLTLGPNSSINTQEDAVYFTEARGVPQTALDLAVEKCGYRFATPKDIQSDIVEAKLECSWLDEPIYADQADLQKLQDILTGAEFGYVGGCGYGAKLTVRMEDGTELVMFKGTDGCDSAVFGSYGGYFLGDAQTRDFWDIFGVDIEAAWG